MDFYTIFKFLHVLTAIAWVGGGLTLLASNIFSIRSKGEAAVLNSLETMNGLGKLWFVPASLLTVIFGAVATTLGGLWGDFWVILGLAGFGWTFLTGLLFIEPRGLQIAKMLEAGCQAEAIAAGRKLLSIAKFDYTVMVIIVADMVLKPVWTDLLTIGVFAAIIAVGLVVFLLPALRAEPEATAA